MWCVRLDTDTYRDKRVVQLSEQFVPVKIKGDASPGSELAGKYRIGGYPTIVFLNAEGEVVETVIGYQPPKQFAATLERLGDPSPDRAAMMKELLTRLDRNPGDAEAACELALLYIPRGESFEAVRMIELAEEHASPAVTAKLATAYSALGDDLLAKKKFAKAKSYYEKALDRAAASEVRADAHIGIAYSYVGLKRPARAVRQLDDLLQLSDLSEEARQRAQSLREELSTKE